MNRDRKLYGVVAAALLGVILLAGCQPASPKVASKAAERTPDSSIVMATWNVRGYPEKEVVQRDWFHTKLPALNPQVICIQEIANQAGADTFLATESQYNHAAFKDSSDGQDNAIFSSAAVVMKDIDDPAGFQHPAQAAYVSCGGFDAVVVTVHLSWTNTAMRENEKQLLHDVVLKMLKVDPDVIIAGDFNTKEKDMKELAGAIGMEVMAVPGQEGVGTTQAGNRYDYFLISPDLANEEAIGCHIITFSGGDLETAKKVSDHLPVLATFRTDERFKDRE
jgi:endonuclease/exonuclease/phosphatase (EEP) superfamily protein YafD